MNHTKRDQRTAEWFSKARVGVFYHWGRFTGGGNSHEDPETSIPLKYSTVEEFERATPDPERIARNMTAVAKYFGARYVIFTSNHSNDGYTMLYPTQCEGYRNRTTKDYIQPLADECHKQGLKLLLYTQHDPSHAVTAHDGVCITEEYRTVDTYAKLFEASTLEMMERYGDSIDGFWIAGQLPERVQHIPAMIHEKYPHHIVVVNNETDFRSDDVDYATTEFLSNPNIDPAYCRPLGLVNRHEQWGIEPPLSDYNEDIPTCGGWWYNGRIAPDLPFLIDPTFIVKQMVSSLGQRRKWNYVLGLGLDITGSLPPELVPTADACHAFLEWSAESIYDTVGGEGSFFLPGRWNDGAFGSVTVDWEDKTLCYLHVTTPPTGETLEIPTTAEEISTLTDLRTGESIPFALENGKLCLSYHWTDTKTYGDTVLRVTVKA